MMMVSQDGESTLKQRLDAISPHDNTSPADMCRQTILVHEEGFALIDLVVLAVHLFGMPDIAIFVDKFDPRVLMDDVVVGFET